MTTGEVNRKLTAILSADVKDYSRLMAQDDVNAIGTLNEHRDLFSKSIKQYKGRIVDMPGDNILAAFESISNAVNSAVDIQRELAERNAELPSARMMKWRIGISLGEVIEEEGRIYGDGVNIAARIEGICAPGGICISNTVYDQIKNKLGLEYEDLGEHSVKNFEDPVRIYRLLPYPDPANRVDKTKGDVSRRWRTIAFGAISVMIIGIASVVIQSTYFKPAPPSEIAKAKLFSPAEKPSIAVLPFENMSGDPEQEYFVDGMTDEIITRLSKNSMLTVIARHSTFTYKGKPVKVQQVARDLGVQLVLEGSVRKMGDRVRITAQLVNANTGGHIWAETYEREMKDIFNLQAEIAQNIAAALRTEYTETELARVRHIPTDNLTAYDSFWRGYGHFLRFTREDMAKAQKYFQRAIDLDPDYADAYAWLASSYSAGPSIFGDSDSQALDKAFELSEKALSIDSSSIYGHLVQADIYRMRNQSELALSKAEKVISLDPNYADGYNLKGVVLQFLGRCEEAAEIMIIAVTLDPNSALYRWNLGDIYLQEGQYQKANDAYQECIARNSDFAEVYLSLASSYLYQWETQCNDDPKALDIAFKMANKFVAMTDRETRGSTILGWVYALRKQYDSAVAEANKILAKVPESAQAYTFLSGVYSLMGRSDEAIEAAEKAIKINSREPAEFNLVSTFTELGIAYRMKGRIESAIASLRKVFDYVPVHYDYFRAHLNLAILYAESNQVSKAQAEAAEILKLSPDFSVDIWGDRIPYKDAARKERDMAALRKAGLK